MNEKLRINQAGLNIIKERESLSLKSYLDRGKWAIGYGHRGSDVKPGQVITVQHAELLLQSDCQYAENAVRRMVNVELNENQFSALVSFVYNLGEGRFQDSTMRKYINAGDFTRASNEFLKWVSPGTQFEAGLKVRREKEKALFLQV